MSLHDLLPELLKLTPEEMGQAIEILQNHLTRDQSTPTAPVTSYEVWSPQITPAVARQFLEMLAEDTAKYS
jgi:hypothetical protein